MSPDCTLTIILHELNPYSDLTWSVFNGIPRAALKSEANPCSPQSETGANSSDIGNKSERIQVKEGKTEPFQIITNSGVDSGNTPATHPNFFKGNNP